MTGNTPATCTDKAEAFGFVIDEFPSDKHFYVRSLYTNKGTVLIKGKAYGISGYDKVRVKLYKNGALLNIYEQTLSYANNLAQYDFSIPINAELSNYKFQLIGVNNGNETIEASANEVVAGDVFAINGQSNAQAGAAANPSDLSPFMRSYTYANGWNYINLSFPGMWGARLAKKIIDEQGIPVAIFNDAVGAQQITFYLRNDSSPNSGNYGAQKTRLEAAGVGANVRAFLWFQGEADGWTVSTEEYKADFLDLYNDWYSDYNIEEVYIFQVRYGSCSSLYPYILEAHRQSADELSGLHIMSTNNVLHDGCHYPYANGYQTLGDRMYQLVKRDLYGGSTSNVAPPDVQSITVSDDLITIKMTQTNSLTVIGNPWADFQLEGGNVSITGGYVSGNDIFLNLSGEAAGVTAVSYLGHPGSANDWIANPLGVGILSFYDYPISNPIPGGSGGGGGGGNTGTADCNNINISNTGSSITVTGLDAAPISHVQVFDENWSQVFSCAGTCSATENIGGLSTGDYHVYVKFYDASWSPICQINTTLSLNGGNTTIDNDNDGTPADDDCDDNDPTIPTAPGTACNDGDANTTNDVILQDGGTCQGTGIGGGGGGGTGGQINCDNVQIT
ncbi:MAG TPA: hypothetical protein ENJ45_00640, partial [Phaeodactylibacter sp.]|nr:hypothetical protein [Phaeodactylibacter sp.]